MSCDDRALGSFCWYDYDSADADASKAFYTALIGWSEQAWSPAYAMFTSGGAPLGGFRQKSDAAVAGGCPNAWLAYVSVEDVDATVEQAEGLGAKVHVPATDIPGGGRFAVLMDPLGAVFAVHAGDPPPQPKPGMDTPGQVGWHELASSDMPAAWDFYSALFPWKISQDMELPPEMGGTYRLFHACDDNLGGMGGKPPGAPDHWLLYFRIEDLDASLAKAAELGAELVHGPMEVPGGDRVAQLRDPFGAVFALVGPGS